MEAVRGAGSDGAEALSEEVGVGEKAPLFRGFGKMDREIELEDMQLLARTKKRGVEQGQKIKEVASIHDEVRGIAGQQAAVEGGHNFQHEGEITQREGRFAMGLPMLVPSPKRSSKPNGQAGRQGEERDALRGMLVESAGEVNEVPAAAGAVFGEVLGDGAVVAEAVLVGGVEKVKAGAGGFRAGGAELRAGAADAGEERQQGVPGERGKKKKLAAQPEKEPGDLGEKAADLAAGTENVVAQVVEPLEQGGGLFVGEGHEDG